MSFANVCTEVLKNYKMKEYLRQKNSVLSFPFCAIHNRLSLDCSKWLNQYFSIEKRREKGTQFIAKSN